jgi:hypothetical protein
MASDKRISRKNVPTMVLTGKSGMQQGSSTFASLAASPSLKSFLNEYPT